MDFSVHKGETEKQYIWRVSQYVKENKITWRELAGIINQTWREDESEYRDESAYRKPVGYAAAYYDEVFSKMISNEYSNQLVAQKNEIIKERKKIQTEKVEINRWLRESARDEMIIEQITEAIDKLEPINVPPLRIDDYDKSTKAAVLCLADCHYGVEFEIKGLFGEVLNAYSPEIFGERMWALLNKVVDIVTKEDLTELNIFMLGDEINGILRLTSQLMKLRYGIIDSAVRFADFMAQWLNELSQYVRVRLYHVQDSNHNQLRLLGQPKNAFPEENMSKVIMTIIKERLRDNPYVEVIDNPTGLIFADLAGYQVLGVHGEVKNLAQACNDFSRMYNTKIDYIVSAHIHHLKSEEIGFDSEAISVRSLIGVDNYAVSLQKASNAGASIIIFEEGEGKTCQYDIKLREET